MSDLIDREQAKDAIDKYLAGRNLVTDGTFMARLINEIVIDRLPSAQLTFDARDTQNNLPIGTDLISRQAAIDALAEHEKSNGHNYTLFVDIVSECAEIIRDLPSAQAEERTEERTETHACDLISRQAAIDALCAVCGKACDKSKFVYNAPQDEQVILCPEHYCLCTLPSVQPYTINPDGRLWITVDDIDKVTAVVVDEHKSKFCKQFYEDYEDAQPEIIRCRECKFASGDSRICMKFDHSPIGELDFCSFAERREVNNESN